MSAQTAVIQLPENTKGRDFCVGDLHGMYTLLEKLLVSVKFDESKDRLISVGDLIDRGPESPKALFYLNQPWFHAVRGNHEQLLIDHYEKPDDDELLTLWQRNGGGWWKDQPKGMQRAIYRRLCQLPYAMEMPTRRGLIGIVHADIPSRLAWRDFTAALQEGDEKIINHALWSRLRVRGPQDDTEKPIEGVQEIYCGHNIVPSPTVSQNVHLIDTGAYLGSRGRLTMVDMQQGPDYRYSLSNS